MWTIWSLSSTMTGLYPEPKSKSLLLLAMYFFSMDMWNTKCRPYRSYSRIRLYAALPIYLSPWKGPIHFWFYLQETPNVRFCLLNKTFFASSNDKSYFKESKQRFYFAYTSPNSCLASATNWATSPAFSSSACIYKYEVTPIRWSSGKIIFSPYTNSKGVFFLDADKVEFSANSKKTQKVYSNLLITWVQHRTS